MMKQDILIKVNSNNGRVELPTARLGINGENLQGNIIVDFIDEFVDGTAILEIKRNDEKYYLTMTKENSKYKLPILSSLLTEVCTVHFQIRITVGTGNDIPVWKSNIFFLKVEEAINATTTIPEEYAEWIDIANEKLNEIDNLNLEITKEDDKAYFTITKKDGTQETTELSAGLDGITPTIGQNGNWYLGDVDTGKPSRGEKGDKGDKGLKGDTGSAGNDGISPIATVTQTVTGATISITDKNGTTTANISNGDASNYSVLNNKPLINNVTLSGNKTSSDLGLQPAGNYALSSEIPTKTSELTNDSGYITGYTETDPTVPSHVKNITQANITSWNNKSEFSGNYNDLSNKPTIPSEVTESTVGGWGFTKNTGTYSKPNDGIPKADLASAVQTSLGKADTALQTHQDISGKVDIFNDTASGSPAYFIDGLDYFANSVIINIEPVQAGTGTPSLTNIRNITGLTGTVLNVAGEDVQEATTINISWQSEAGTIYGGVLNLTTGVLTKTKALVEYAVSNMNNSESYPGWKNTGIGEIIGNGLQAKINTQLNIGSVYGVNTTGTASTVYLPPASYNNLNQTAWKTQYPDLVIQIVVEYETPITYQLTPQEVRILAGINNIWATCGDVTVNYKADTKKYIDSRIQAIEDRLSLLEG